MAPPPSPRGLHALARLHGIQTAYHDNDGRRVGASADTLLAALRALRVPVRSAADIPRLAAHRRRRLWERALEPVVVAWVEAPPARSAGTGDRRNAAPNAAPGRSPAGAVGGRPRGRGATGPVDPDAVRATFPFRLPVRHRDRPVRAVVGLESGGVEGWVAPGASLRVLGRATVDGVDYVELEVPLPGRPVGYHDLAVEVGSGAAMRRHEALLIAAPRRARGWDVLQRRPAWGLFVPLYALPGREPGPLPGGEVPTYGDLARLAEAVADRGGAVVATLPLLAAFLGERPYDPSPYAPVSRLFWNELYIDPIRALEVQRIGEAERFAAYATPAIRAALFEREEGSTPLGRASFVEGSRVAPAVGMRLRRAALEGLAERFFQDGEPAELAGFRARNPRADDYAAFRALVEARGPWRDWPDRLRARDVRPGDVDPDVARYHLYVQWLADRQLAEAKERAESRGVGLYLDLPLGVHPDGYDVWRERALFAVDASAGAPPDALATGGQDWGFPPLHPEASRRNGHRYLIASIRKHLRFARVLRIDHVMQLHRLYWVPAGDARNGVYVRYPAEELYALLCVESHRAGAVIVGEDLGTVPRDVRRGMRRHGLPGMYVAQFQLRDTRGTGPDGREAPALEPGPVPAGALASIGTHDTPTFAGWWSGRDIELLRDLGRIPEEAAEAELRGRAVMREKLVRGLLGDAEEWAGVGEPELARRVQAALLRRLGRSGAGLVLATMEDLWLETEPQNVPGTAGGSNWRRRAARPLEALGEPDARGLLEALNGAREGRG